MRKVTGSSPVLPIFRRTYGGRRGDRRQVRRENGSREATAKSPRRDPPYCVTDHFKGPMATAINEQIKILAQLQKVDVQIHELKKEFSTHPALLQKEEASFEKKKAGLKQAEDEHKALQMKQKEREIELQTKEEKIKKLQAQLYQLKSNKEYAAMELEIKGLKADNSLLEEEILHLLDDVDQAKAKCTKEKEVLAVEDKKLKEGMAAIQKKGEEISAVIAVLEEKRKSYTPNVDTKLLSQYEKILKNRDGIALVPVKNGSCGGCHIELPPQVVNEIQIQDKLIVCESCARILYWPL